MFPPHNAIIYRNELGEVTGWDVECEPEYCDIHGVYHPGGECPPEKDDDD